MDEPILEEDVLLDEPVEPESLAPEPSTPEPEKTVPYPRFQEVYRKQKELEQEIGTLKEQKKTEGLSPEQQKELEAKQYLKRLVVEALEESKTSQIQTEQKEQVRFEREVDEILEIHPDVKRNDFLKFVEEKSDAYGLESVKGTMKVYLDLQKAGKEGSETTKENILRKPGLPSSEGGKSVQGPPSEDKNKSFGAVVQDILKGLK